MCAHKAGLTEKGAAGEMSQQSQRTGLSVQVGRERVWAVHSSQKPGRQGSGSR